jgi:hypothetical protein
MSPETESNIVRQLTTFEELVKHLTTKEETALLKVDLEKFRTALILWIIGTNIAVGAVLLSVMLYLNNQLISQFRFILEHWKP